LKQIDKIDEELKLVEALEDGTQGAEEEGKAGEEKPSTPK